MKIRSHPREAVDDDVPCVVVDVADGLVVGPRDDVATHEVELWGRIVSGDGGADGGGCCNDGDGDGGVMIHIPTTWSDSDENSDGVSDSDNGGLITARFRRWWQIPTKISTTVSDSDEDFDSGWVMIRIGSR
ncbi:hypothetical protein AKJ16_DCAP18095 [Drosera capensis]